jgi:D-beta-D-heptose 7-phosphate kinase/D-beta-D-heptose 1-phosphate adenosyltransferase
MAETPVATIQDLLEKDRTPKRIAVVGDAMLDVWSDGSLGTGQEDCPKFIEKSRVVTPGGAGNAARQLAHWNAHVCLIAPITTDFLFPGIDLTYCLRGASMPVKHRHFVGGKCVYRIDSYDEFDLDAETLHAWQNMVVKAIHQGDFDAVLISDYAKGFLEDTTIEEIVSFCKDTETTVVADPKRDALTFSGAVLKINDDYPDQGPKGVPFTQLVVTHGARPPFCAPGKYDFPELAPVPCINHVGAGDCFAAHLTLALAHGASLTDAARIAHSAGRVFVQHPYGRPPWPHEIARDLDPHLGKVLAQPSHLRDSLDLGKRIVFTNGVWRLPHAGHSWMLRWARSQGDVLVVGVNDDASARRNKGPENFILPLEERLEWLASLDCVDWVVPYTATSPQELIAQLRPDVLVKGHEYQGRRIPGDDLVEDVRFAPENAFPRHCTDLVEEIRRC